MKPWAPRNWDQSKAVKTDSLNSLHRQVRTSQEYPHGWYEDYHPSVICHATYRRYGSFWGKRDGIIHTAVTKWTCCLTLRFRLLDLLFTSLKFPVLPAENRRRWVRTYVFAVTAKQDMTHPRLFLLPVLGATISNRPEQIISLRSVPFSSLNFSLPSLYSRGWLLYIPKKKASFPFHQTSLPLSAPSFHAMAVIQTNDLALLNLLSLPRNSIISFSLSMPRSRKF